MRNATPLKPRQRPQRSATEVARWKKRRADWVAGLEPTSLFHRLFDHVPGVHFFAKDKDGRLMFASRGLLDRYQMTDDSEFMGRTDFDLNPETMAQAYVDDDKRVLNWSMPMVERIELWWDSQGMPDWFLVTKLPLDVNANTGGAFLTEIYVPIVSANYEMYANTTQANTYKASVLASVA